ncbi:uncharacterized protein MONOS_8737 [Monocercomonoides exilis]|uniref:uncharacterized protein n=1 Tax=Monocercomonoides exilis TaxID=2049356 RepID=UPI0035597F54|nr:hypothetical protein MONOS_8737 [Monocercomonoides exilis]|eukprot:MONOS_8737.1-p1 / transcript=MONOS_8737.1 / gene=MONOS_8737 / organism=Monocercomonoides_exilis_PA203 / gene_product=unspecified product / transcript_product=unspecified product / location=Mono_scaffold00337:23904-26597(+) / protein_length=735 / sequence_SO=supercontig / SO=protein_coding / is_pseudo=false
MQVLSKPHSLNAVLTNWKEKEAYDHPDLNQLSGNEKDSSNQVIPLVLFFRVFSPPAYVGPEGSDYSLCGFSDYPCCSILAAIRLFDGINATIQLSQHFVFLDRICLNKTNTTIAVEQIGTQINVQNGGSGEGDGLIETQTDVTFWGITLSAPPLLTERTTLFECSGSTLSFQDFRTAAAPLPEGLKYAYSFVHVKRGTLTCTRFSVSDSSYGPVPLIVAIGNSLDAVKCNFVNISIISTYSQSINGLIYVLDTETLTIENMTSNFCTQELCALVSATDVNLFSVKSSNFKRIERISGFGGVISASVRDGHELTVSNTSFDGCAITQENMKGGSLSVSVEKSGRFAFDSSTVKLSTVCGENSCGGGIYASFSEESVQYSMKRVAFSQNKAEYGKHFYLACPSPRNVVKSALFTSSFSEEMDDADLWVCNSLDILSKGETMKKYLFSSSRETMFVDEGQGVDPSNCGNETHPCTSLDIGFSKMTEIQSVILILFSATAQGTINRRDKSLSIDGKSKSSILLIESDAHFELTNGNRSTSLTFSKLTISLPALFNNKELIKAFVGILSMKAIDIVSSTQEQTQAHLWIISGGRGIIQLDEVSVEGLNFSVNAGICSIDGGSCILEHCNISVCSSDHVGLVAFNNNANASIKQSSFQRCKMNHGSIIRACNCAAVELSDSCMIEDCISLSSDGCAINCLMSESCKLRVPQSKLHKVDLMRLAVANRIIHANHFGLDSGT